MIGLDGVVGVLLADVSRGGLKFFDDARVDRRPIGGDLDRPRPAAQRAGKELPYVSSTYQRSMNPAVNIWTHG